MSPQERWRALAAVLLICCSAAALADKKDTLDSIRAKRPSAKPAPRKPAPRRPAPAPRPAARTEPAATAEPKTQWLVAKLGGGDSKSIAEAVKKVPAGTRIVVRGGIYPESLILTRPVEIAPEAFDKPVIIEGATGPAVRMEAEDAVIRGITLRGAPSAGAKVPYAVDVAKGRLVLEECELGSGAKGCVLVHGKGTTPYLRKCRISSATGDGAVVTDGAGGSFEECDFYESAGVQARVTGRANPTFQSCGFRKGKTDGIVVSDGGLGQFLRCEVLENQGQGLSISRGGNPVLQDCTFRANIGNAVQVTEQGRGAIQGGSISRNLGSGAQISASDFKITGCRIAENKKDGVSFIEGALGTVERCEITGNGWNAVSIYTRADPVIRNCQLRNHNSCGVVVNNGGKGTIEDCELSGSRNWAALSIFTQAEPVVRRCRIFGNQHEGLKVWDHSKGLIEECEIYKNGWTGITVQGASDPLIRRCKIYENTQLGFHAAVRAAGTLEECEFWSNRGGNLKIEHSTTVTRGIQQR